MRPDQIAHICWHANSAYRQEVDEAPGLTWEESRASTVAGVMLLMIHPDHGPEDLHFAWMSRKLEEGWRYGAELDAGTKLHPCIRPWRQLKPEQQIKDKLFEAIARVLLPRLSGGA